MRRRHLVAGHSGTTMGYCSALAISSLRESGEEHTCITVTIQIYLGDLGGARCSDVLWPYARGAGRRVPHR